MPLASPEKALTSQQSNRYPPMNLTAEEQDILAGEQGTALQKALSVLVRYGEAFGATELASIRSAHLVGSAGCVLYPTYIRFLRDVVTDGHRVRVPTTLNPRPFDPGDGSILGRLIFIRQGQLESMAACLGCDAAYTCTPYFGPNVPAPGDAVAWAESSAAAYANSVLGARTNPTPAMIDVCSAILGRTPQYGLLLDENRRGTHLVTVQAQRGIDYGVLGYLIARELLTGVPVIDGIQPGPDDLKTLGAVLGAAGGMALFHVRDVTPEARALGRGILRSDHSHVTIGAAELKRTEQALRRDSGRFSHVIIGCPHLSFQELQRIATALGGRRVRGRLWLLACHSIRRRLQGSAAERSLREAGAELKSLCPIYFHETPRLFGKRILTDSVKLAHHTGSAWAPLEECLSAAQR